MSDVDYTIPRKRLEGLLDELLEHLKGIRERVVYAKKDDLTYCVEHREQVSAETVHLAEVLVAAFLKAHAEEVKALAPETTRRGRLGGGT